MCVNDLIVQGARPYLFLDYISLSKIELHKLKIIKGIIAGCSIANCKLVGGETVEMPERTTMENLILKVVGIVDRDKILPKKKKNDLILVYHLTGFLPVFH